MSRLTVHYEMMLIVTKTTVATEGNSNPLCFIYQCCRQATDGRFIVIVITVKLRQKYAEVKAKMAFALIMSTKMTNLLRVARSPMGEYVNYVEYRFRKFSASSKNV